MASQNPSDVPAFPVVRDFSTIEEIIDYIVNTRQARYAHDGDCAGESLLGFHWQASEVDELSKQLDARLVELEELKIHRFEYDYESATVYLDILGESRLHYTVRMGRRDHIKNHIAKSLATAKDVGIRALLRSIDEPGTAVVECERNILKQPDGESRQRVEKKSRQYIDSSDGKIQVALIIDLQYPGMKKAWVSLLAADDSSSSWVQHSDLFHDDHLDQQPAGQLALYLSDFVGMAPGIPAALCRPSTAEVAAGITRNPTIALTYERLRAIFRRARHLHSPTEFTMEAGDEEENPYEEMERRLATANEERTELERRLATANEERTEMERRLATANEERTELERRVVEMERRLAEGRLEAE
ncbi:hypothetical protein C8A01DRAFT_48494 [Parachaetomium inaequale]|uniref:Uncharacterized protein n=1 Tax=Parachaetomium inaequale TaxID=2588326 RepID=A0AAN6PEK8_9PEZI|nr:hypothetical protein C8A01DRAFT_48494 [Parachaetomium inaequale]